MVEQADGPPSARSALARCLLCGICSTRLGGIRRPFLAVPLHILLPPLLLTPEAAGKAVLEVPSRQKGRQIHTTQEGLWRRLSAVKRTRQSATRPTVVRPSARTHSPAISPARPAITRQALLQALQALQALHP